jgi:hypothetical protein
MFLGLIWCKILCWAQKSILYWVWNATGSHESPKTKFVSHEIFISRVTYRSEILSWTQKSIRYGVWNGTTNHESPNIWINFNFWNNKDYWHVFKYQSTIFNHLGLFMFIGSSIADTQHIFFFDQDRNFSKIHKPDKKSTCLLILNDKLNYKVSTIFMNRLFMVEILTFSIQANLLLFIYS